MFHSKSQKRIAKALGRYHFKSREKKVSMEVFQRFPVFHLDEYPAQNSTFQPKSK